MAPRQVLERGDDVGGNLRVAEVERPADHLERQLCSREAVFEPPGNGAALHHVGAFERHIQHRALFHLAPVPDAADRNVQAEVLDPHRLAGARFAVPDADLADGEKMVHEPDLLAARAQVGEFGAAQDATVVLRSLVGRLRAVVGPVGRLVDQRVEGLDGAAGGEPVACVALVRQAGQLEEADARGLAGERAGDCLRMIAAVLVIVRDDDHVGAGQMIGKGRVPLVAHRLHCRLPGCRGGRASEHPSRPRPRTADVPAPAPR